MTPDGAEATPLVSLVVPTYDVLPFLPDFVASLDAQNLGPADLADVEVVVVDDGSTDGSGAYVTRWAATSALTVRVVRQDNQGLAAARNAGLDLARGSWVSFPDPDDVLGDGYLRAVLGRLRDLVSGPDEVALLATRILLLSGDGIVRDRHPLHARFDAGSRVVDLDVEPDVIHLQAASAFFRLDLLRATGLRFDAEIRPNFEDAFLTAHYLAAAPAPRIALLAEARYVYRRRADGTSMVQQSWHQPEKYTVLPRVGYLRLLEEFAARDKPVPTWVQNLVLYDLLFYFREDMRMHAATAGLDPALCSSFHELVAAILVHVEPDSVAEFAVIPTSWALLQALRVGYQEPYAVPDRLHVWRLDGQQQILQLRYVYGRRTPTEEFVVGGRRVEPVHAKIRDIVLFGRTVAYERIVWLPATAALQVRLDRRRVPLVVGPPEQGFVVDPATVWQELANRPVPRRQDPGRRTSAARRPRLRRMVAAVGPVGVVGAAGWRRARSRLAPWRVALTRRTSESPRQRADRLLLARVAEPGTRKRFGHAWAFMDRDTMAQDNAEHLYRWVRRHHPEVNAWFVLSPRSSDWTRLELEGFRLVDPESDDFVLLMLSTSHRISSQADHYVVRPLDEERFGRARGRFTFLQHGVIKDDLSRWLSGKRISRFVTTTPDEYASVAGDHSPYRFTSKEVALTGLPRHDRLLVLGAATPSPRWLLVAPTWRRDLFEDTTTGNDRTAREGLWDSPYLRGWLEVLGSSSLRVWAAEHGLELGFLPHPNLDAHITGGLPEGVTLLRYAEQDVQEVLANAAVLITDYSSLGFEQAYLGRPVFYLQADAGQIFSGSHIGRRGPWSYREHGFGPVCDDLAGLEDALRRLLTTAEGLLPEPMYADRMERTFLFRDGRCCERVFDSIVALDRPAPAVLAVLRSGRLDHVLSYNHIPAVAVDDGQG